MIIPSFRDEDTESERLNYFPEVTQLVSVDTELEPQVSGFKRTVWLWKWTPTSPLWTHQDGKEVRKKSKGLWVIKKQGFVYLLLVAWRQGWELGRWRWEEGVYGEHGQWGGPMWSPGTEFRTGAVWQLTWGVFSALSWVASALHSPHKVSKSGSHSPACEDIRE